MKIEGYEVVFEESNDGWSAYVPSLPGFASWGDTREELLESLIEGVPFHLEGLRLNGDPVPARDDASEKLIIRLPRGLFEDLSRLGKQDGTDVQTEAVALLSREVGRRDAASRC